MDKRRLRDLRDPETLRMLVWNLPVGIYITTSTGQLLDANPGCLEIFGAPSLEQLCRYSVSELYCEPLERERELELLHRKGYVNEYELRLRHPESGRVRTVLDTCYAVGDTSTEEVLYHGILMDVTEHKALQHQLEQLSLRDQLTGCFNRRYLAQIGPTLQEGHATWGAVLVNVDGFRDYNKEHGHEAGDELLLRVSRFLMRQVRSEDAVARVGGDEFLVLLLDDSAQGTEAVARRIADQPTDSFPASLSLGWAVREGDEDLERTLLRADRSLMQVRAGEPGQGRRRRRSSPCILPDR